MRIRIHLYSIRIEYLLKNYSKRLLISTPTPKRNNTLKTLYLIWMFMTVTIFALTYQP